MRDICEILNVVSASQEEILDAIDKSSFADFEDCLQDKCAKEIGADYIITCNTKDFENSEIAALNPKECERNSRGKENCPCYYFDQKICVRDYKQFLKVIKEFL